LFDRYKEKKYTNAVGSYKFFFIFI